MRSPCTLALLLALTGLACGASTPEARGPEVSDEEHAEELARERRERRRQRDLENQVAQLKAKLATIQPRPALPVEVREPEAEPERSGDYGSESSSGYGVEPASDPSFAPEGDSEVVVAGYDEDGAEILYVGEAARAPAVRPRVQLGSKAAGPQRPARPKVDRTRPASRRAIAPVPTTDARLDVTRVAVPKVSEVAPTAPNPGAGQRPAPRQAVRRSGAGEVQEEYRRAYQALRDRDYGAAVARFKAFLRDHPRHAFSDNAQYWLGETYYDQRQFDRALAAFEKVIQNYPDGNKAAGAKLKAAYCHIALGDSERATTLLRRLIAEHPKSRPARLAAEKLDTL